MLVRPTEKLSRKSATSGKNESRDQLQSYALRKHSSAFDERDLRWFDCHIFRSFKPWLSLLRLFSPFKTPSFDFLPCAVLLVQVSHLYETELFFVLPFGKVTMHYINQSGGIFYY